VLLGGRAVVAEAVGLDDQLQVGPEEVDAEVVHALAGERLRQAGPQRNRDEQALELGIGEREGADVEDANQLRRSRPSVKFLNSSS
jgi:hypothetical protein